MFLCALAAFAGENRAYKFEVYQYAPVGRHLESSDWAPTDAEMWAGILDCDRVDPRRDRCVFRDDRVWIGFHLDAEPALRAYPLPISATLEVRYGSDGTIASWDLVGDREALRTAISATVLERFHRTDREYTADQARTVGQVREETIIRLILGVLEVQRPVEPPILAGGVPAWRLSTPPTAGRVATQGVMSVRGVGAELPAGENVRVGVDAEVSDSGYAAGWLTADALVDAESGRLIRQRIEVVFHRQVADIYSRRTLLIGPVTPEMTGGFGELPGGPL